MKTISGNILDVGEGIICHQVNCMGVANAGLARQIRNKWPGWFALYSISLPVFGDVKYYHLSPKLVIASLYAQVDYGRRERRRYTNYAALGSGLFGVRVYNRDYKLPVYVPYGLGCGLGGGDWNIVSQIIEDALPDAIVVKLTKTLDG